MRIQTYLINLDGSDARLDSASAQLAAENIAFERVPAFDGRGRDLASLPDFDFEAGNRYMGRPMRGGEVGCYLSHLDCLRRFLGGDADYVLIFEDDLELAPNFHATLRDILGWLESRPEDWDLINLGGERKKIYSPVKVFGAHTLIRAHYFPMSSTGMLWTRKGAEEFVRRFSHIVKPYDNAIRDWQSRVDRGLSVLPRMVSPGSFDSEIDGDQSRRGNDGRNPLAYGLAKHSRLWRAKLSALMNKRRWQKRG